MGARWEQDKNDVQDDNDDKDGGSVDHDNDGSQPMLVDFFEMTGGEDLRHMWSFAYSTPDPAEYLWCIYPEVVLKAE